MLRSWAAKSSKYLKSRASKIKWSRNIHTQTQTLQGRQVTPTWSNTKGWIKKNRRENNNKKSNHLCQDCVDLSGKFHLKKNYDKGFWSSAIFFDWELYGIIDSKFPSRAEKSYTLQVTLDKYFQVITQDANPARKMTAFHAIFLLNKDISQLLNESRLKYKKVRFFKVNTFFTSQ